MRPQRPEVVTSLGARDDGAIGGGQAYDAAIREKAKAGHSGEGLFIGAQCFVTSWQRLLLRIEDKSAALAKD